MSDRRQQGQPRYLGEPVFQCIARLEARNDELLAALESIYDHGCPDGFSDRRCTCEPRETARAAIAKAKGTP